MEDQDLLRNLQRELAEDYCEPFRGEQKEECVNYYEKWISKEEGDRSEEEPEKKCPE